MQKLILLVSVCMRAQSCLPQPVISLACLIHIRSDGNMITISCHVLIDKMGKRLPVHIGNDGNLLTISCYFLIDMKEGCLPIHIRSNATMPTISCSFFIHIMEKRFTKLSNFLQDVMGGWLFVFGYRAGMLTMCCNFY